MFTRPPSLPLDERILFMRRLALFLRAGIPLHRALLLLHEDTVQAPSKVLILSLAETVASGQKLSDGFVRFPKTFDPVLIGFIRTGEMSGTLANHVSRGADLIYQRAMIARSVTSAMIYPCILLCATLGVSGFLTLYAFPKMIPLFKGFHTTLPPATRMLLGIHDLIVHEGWLLSLGTGCILSGFIFLQRYSHMRRAQEYAVLHAPLLGVIIRNLATASITRILGTLLESGMPVLLALEMAEESCLLITYKEAVHAMRIAVNEGRRLSEGFTVPQNLYSGASICEDYMEERLRTLSTLIEPVLMIVMGLIVGFVALAIITPIYTLTQGLGTH
jgi:type II secretory pathway component PulF